MADITPQRENIDEELANFNSALSEAFFFLLGGAINFINDRQYDTWSFFLNGRYDKAAGTTGLEGLHVFQFDAEIIGISFGNLVSGSSGTTTLDIHKIDGGGTDQGSIFTTKASIASTSSNNAYAAENFLTATTQTSTGLTLPAFLDDAARQFNQFDALRIDIDSVMAEAENAFINIHFRPR